MLGNIKDFSLIIHLLRIKSIKFSPQKDWMNLCVQLFSKFTDDGHDDGIYRFRKNTES